MAVHTRMFHVATCDGCTAKLTDSNDATIVAATPVAIDHDAQGEGWITYQGNLCCTTCVTKLATGPHDYVRHVDEPGCLICEGIANGHTNVPVAGQLEIGAN